MSEHYKFIKTSLNSSNDTNNQQSGDNQPILGSPQNQKGPDQENSKEDMPNVDEMQIFRAPSNRMNNLAQIQFNPENFNLDDLKLHQGSSKSISSRFKPNREYKRMIDSSESSFNYFNLISNRERMNNSINNWSIGPDLHLSGCQDMSLNLVQEEQYIGFLIPTYTHTVTEPNSQASDEQEEEREKRGLADRKKVKLNNGNSKKVVNNKDENQDLKDEPKKVEEIYFPDGNDDQYNNKNMNSVPLHDQPQKPTNVTGESLHRNVYQNFGNAIIKMVQMHSLFIQISIDYFKNDQSRHDKFIDWLKQNIKLVNQQDYERGWTIYKNDDPLVREYQELLRVLSQEFLENYAIQYLVNSQKMTDFEIHIKSVGTFLNCLQEPKHFKKFTPIN